MQIVMKNINELIPYVNNARKNDHAVDAVASSIKNYGFKQPIVIDSHGEVVAGHTRLKAAKKLNMEQVPCIVADDLTPAQIKAYRIADNKVAELSEWDMELLKVELEDIEGFTGFEVDELQDLFEDEAKEENFDAKEASNEIVEPVTQRGWIYKLGNHRLMCGDSTNKSDVKKLMNGITPDLIHTDPPYGMNAVSKSGVLKEKYKIDIIGDDNVNVAKESFKLIYSLYPNAKQIWWGANYYSSVLPDSECWLVWDKNNGESDQTDCELAWANFRSVVRQFTQASEKNNRVHPTQKPVSLMEWIVKRFNLTSETIADFFGGSGSTLIAAEKHKKKCFIMEFDPKFCDVIVKRWEDYTGLKAERIE